MSNGPLSSGAAQGELLAGRAPVRRPRRASRALAVALIVAGALVLADAAVTLLWQEPLSALYGLIQQDRLNGALRSIERASPTAAESRTLASISDERSRIAFLARELEAHSGNGSPIGRIVIPRIGASFVVVKGTDTGDLERGPGVYSDTSFPGLGHTTAIAGHRTTFLAPFRHIDALGPGSTIRLEMPYAEFTYAVLGQRVVAPTDVAAAITNIGYTRLVLSACTPLFSAAKRLLVYARLVRAVPRGAARTLPDGVAVTPIEPHRPVPRHALPPVLESLDPHAVAPLV